MSDQDRPTFRFEDGGFAVVVVFVTLAFAWLIAPYFGAILWGVVAAIVCAPAYRMISERLGGRSNLAASLLLVLILVVAIVPALVIGASLIDQASAFYGNVKGNRLDIDGLLLNLNRSLPSWVTHALSAYGPSDMNELGELVHNGLSKGLQAIASHAFIFGQGALALFASLTVMLYLTFFLLRDGVTLNRRIRSAVPLRPEIRDRLVDHFVMVVRATIKGTVVVAILQGLVGGIIFWMLGIPGALLWGLAMGFFSLIPAIGTGIIWVPVAAYLLVTGAVWQGVVLILCGLFVIGMIDNLVQPFLVGKDTRMPDFVVLIATLSGIELFGLNGVIIGPVIAALFIAVWTSVSEWRGLSAEGRC